MILCKTDDERKRVRLAIMRQIELRHEEIADSIMLQLGNDVEPNTVVLLGFSIQVQSDFLFDKVIPVKDRK